MLRWMHKGGYSCEGRLKEQSLTQHGRVADAFTSQWEGEPQTQVSCVVT